MNEPGSEEKAVETVVEQKKRRFSVVWLIPAVAAVLGLFLAIKTAVDRGPEITISFATAAGIEVGKTRIKYKDIVIGTVTEVNFSDDLKNILVTAEIEKSAAGLMTDDAQFWVVLPRIGADGISGLDTLVSGTFIQMDPGQGGAGRDFVGLEQPPVVLREDPGSEFNLTATAKGSIEAGAPIHFKGVSVGQVLSSALSDDGERIDMKIFIESPYDDFVRIDSRFWNTSGVDLVLDANGIQLRTESLTTIIAGGIEFDAPNGRRSAAASAGMTFPLYPDLESAVERRIQQSVRFVMNFKDSVRGLSVGAPVEFRGIQIGEVSNLRLEFDPENGEPRIPVELDIEPERALDYGFEGGQKTDEAVVQLIGDMVQRGLRGRLASGNLVTGALFVDLDFYPDEPAATLARDGLLPEIPTVESTLAQITATATQVMDTIGALPLEETVRDLRGLIADTRLAVRDFGALANQADGNIAPVLVQLNKALASADRALTEGESALVNVDSLTRPDGDLDRLMRELRDAARGIRLFVEFLEKNPEALISGKQ